MTTSVSPRVNPLAAKIMSRLGIEFDHWKSCVQWPYDSFLAVWDLRYPAVYDCLNYPLADNYSLRPSPALVFSGSLLNSWCDEGRSEKMAWLPESGEWIARQHSGWQYSVTIREPFYPTSDPVLTHRTGISIGVSQISEVRDVILKEIPCPEIIQRPVDLSRCSLNYRYEINEYIPGDAVWGFAPGVNKGVTPKYVMKTSDIWRMIESGKRVRPSIYFER